MEKKGRDWNKYWSKSAKYMLNSYSHYSIFDLRNSDNNPFLINEYHSLLICRYFRPQEGIPYWIELRLPTMWLNLFSWDSHRFYTFRKYFSLCFCLFSYLPCWPICSLSSPSHSAPHSGLTCNFLTYLSFIYASYTSVTTPKVINELLYQRRTLGGFLTQLFVEYYLGGSEIIIFIIMAYDHYVVICKPLYYMTIMQHWLCQLLEVVSWTGGIQSCHCADSFHGQLALLWS